MEELYRRLQVLRALLAEAPRIPSASMSTDEVVQFLDTWAEWIEKVEKVEKE
jgi:hypothetical protein